VKALKDIQKVYFLGIGGIGMSALARYFRHAGKEVAGYDKTPTALTDELQQEGIAITFEDSLSTLMKHPDLVVMTPAIPKDSIQLKYYKESEVPLKKRAEVLALIANSMFNISIGGSHGKTSTSCLTAHILKTAGLDVAAFLGGISLNFKSNFIAGDTFAVAEADEFDRSFHHLHPNVALVTSVDTDHLDIYGDYASICLSFKKFLSNVRQGGSIFIHHKVDRHVIPPLVVFQTYAVNDSEADYYAENIRVENGAYLFDLVTPSETIEALILRHGGRHNVENAVGASAIALSLGVKTEQLREALMTFQGVRRRFETHIQTDTSAYIDDYAHHPREIDAALISARELYPGRKLTVIFQPHLFSRTSDLAAEFAQSLDKADEVILLPIYPARELPIPGVSSKMILEKMTSTRNRHLVEMHKLIDLLDTLETDVVMTVGAGDIDTMVSPIRNWMQNKMAYHG
jgi:UDP-N-acetylmuramate--alanine ligase